MRPSSRRILGVAVLVVLLAACSVPKARPEDPAPGDRRSASPGPSPSAGEVACRVKGFVPGHTVALDQVRLTLLYGGREADAPTGGRAYPRVGDVMPGVRVVEPADGTLDRALARSIGSSVADGSTRALPDEQLLAVRPGGAATTRRDWAVYGVARVYRGHWTARFCGGRVNDGSRVDTWRGTFTTVGRLHPGALRCDVVRRGTGGLNRAARPLCLRD